MKKKYRLVLFTILVLIQAIPGFSQSRSQSKRLTKKGDRYFRKEDYHQAYDYYNQALTQDSANAQALYAAGITRLLLFNDKHALDYLLRAHEMDSAVDKHYDYWLGRAYHTNLQFDKAVEAYNRYLEEEISKRDDRQESVKTLILQAGFGKAYQGNPVDYDVQPLGEGLNSPYSDHSPILTEDKQTMYFTSRRLSGRGKSNQTYRGDGWENIYVASSANGNWNSPSLLSGNVNRRKQHTSNVQLYDNDSKMLVYKSVKYGSLFLSENQGGTWSKPREFSQYTNTGKYEPNGFVIQDESVVYFSSSKGNRNGNLDIWVSRRDEKDSTRWGQPERLPDVINTDADEDAPFIAADGLTLYFCSRGHDSMGGFDVFKSVYEPFAKTWSKPTNLGHPINSPADDIYFVTDSLAKTGYVSSNREGTVGQEDIFAVRMFENVLVKGQVSVKSSSRPLPNFVLTFDSQRRMGIKGSTFSTERGDYSLNLRSGHNYTVEVRNPQGQVVLTDQLEIPLVSEANSEIIKNFQIDVPDTLAAFAANRLVLKNLNLLKISYNELDSLIINGEVADNEGTVTSATVRIREEESPNYLYETTSGSNGQYRFGLLPGKQTDYVIEITKPGYLLYSAVILYNNQPDRFTTEADIQTTRANQIDVRSVLTSIAAEDLKVGARAVLGGVYFEFNSANLLPESSIALDKLADYLRRNPRVAMEIGGHTDNLGPAYVNKFLSQKRAQAVVNYLIQKDIPKSRVSAVGYGESQPIASNDRELNGRDVNRRVEIKVLRR